MAVDPNLLVVKTVSELPSKATPDSADEFLIYDGTDLKKSTWSNVTDYLASGITGEATQSNAPGSVGFERWIVSTPLTLPNSWGFEVTQAELDLNEVFFNVTDGVVSKQLSEKRIPALTNVLDPLNETLAVNGKAVGDFAYSKLQYNTQFLIDTAIIGTLSINDVAITDEVKKKEILKKIDQSIKSIKLFNVPDNKFLVLRSFTFTPSGNVTFQFDLINSATEVGTPSADIFLYAYPSSSQLLNLETRLRYSSYTMNLIVDTSNFTDKISANFRDGNSQLSYKSAGIKQSAINNLPIKPMWGLSGYLLRSSAAKDFPDSYYFHEAIKGISLKSETNNLVRLSGISFNAPSQKIIFVILVCDDDIEDNLIVNSGRNGYATLRIEIPIATTGLKRFTSFVLSGTSSVEMKILIDMTYINSKLDIATNGLGISTSNETANFIIKPSESGGGSTFTSLDLLTGAEDFQGNFKFSPSTMNWTYDASSNMSKLIRIPEGTTSLDFTMSLDGGASNAIYLDKDMKLISKVHNTLSTISSINSVPPVGAVFILCSTTSLITNAKIEARGLMTLSPDIKDYRSINEGLADKFSGLIFSVNGFYYKKEIDGICTVKEYTSLDKGWLDSLDEYEKDSSYIIPTNIFHSNGVNQFTGGTLCAVKDGVMYFYNAKDCVIFKSEDNGATYSVIFDKYSHPIWGLENNNTESRSNIILLDNGEIMFPVRVTGDEIDSPTRRERYWTMYRSKNNQTDVEKCFTFTHEDVIKDWLDPGDPQYGWANYSGGCLLGDFTHDTNGSMIVITEYGIGTSKYWLTQDPPVPNNGRGISARAWVSMDYGVTWKKMFDGDRKISGLDETDNNWFYFTETRAAKQRHIHGIFIDKYREKVFITNGDGEDYIWSVNFADLQTWYNTAPAVDPNENPSYKITDTFPTWQSESIVPLEGKSNDAYSSMRSQMMQGIPVEKGWVWAHDAAREFAFLSYYNNSEFVFEPVFQYEQESDFASTLEFSQSWVSTDGFVQQISKQNGVIYFTHSNGGTRPARIWATIDGINWKVVYEGDNSDLRFAGKFFIDQNGIYLSDGTYGQASSASGFWKLKVK